MPAYKYQCTDCNEIEVMVYELHEVHTAPLCPKCDKEMVRLFGLQTIRFIGGGWGKDAR
jgi:putative FmdB family regulatory protein